MVLPDDAYNADSPASEPHAVPDQVHGYCVKCQAVRLMAEVQIVTTEDGRKAAKGTCPVCGTTIIEFLP